MFYLEKALPHDKIGDLQVEMIDQLSIKYLLKINGLPGCVCPYGGYDLSVAKQVLAEII